MEPFEALTDYDLQTIKDYIHVYGGTHCGPLEKVLQEWNKNKRTLFKAFGNKLSISKQISFPQKSQEIKREIREYYSPYIIYIDTDVKLATPEYLMKFTRSNFITDVTLYWIRKGYSVKELGVLTQLFNHSAIVCGQVTYPSSAFCFSSFNCTLKPGMKIMKTIQRILKLTKYPNMYLFEEWRNKINLIQSNKEKNVILTLSINPVDFMSMSDNNCGWRSCMSWDKGCYNAGTLEMMNSNVAAIAYIESQDKMKLCNEKSFLSNKKWRALIFIHKKLLLLGKQYPYHNTDIVEPILDMARNSVEKNLNWHYQFINQEYRDLKNFDGNFYLRDWFNVDYDKKKNHHCIFVYTNGMYNDIIESHYPHYYCCRNYVPRSLKICLSGPATCICCGKRIVEESRSEIYNYDDLGEKKLCESCREHNYCDCCHEYHYNIKYPYSSFGNCCSDECAKDMIVFPNARRTKRICKKEDLQWNCNSAAIVFIKELEESDSLIRKIEDDFIKNVFNISDLKKWNRNILKEYSNKIDAYILPGRLTTWPYADLSYFGSNSYIIKAKGQDFRLYTYIIKDNYFYSEANMVYEKVKGLQYRISLKEWLEGV